MGFVCLFGWGGHARFLWWEGDVSKIASDGGGGGGGGGRSEAFCQIIFWAIPLPLVYAYIYCTQPGEPIHLIFLARGNKNYTDSTTLHSECSVFLKPVSVN